MNQGKNYRKNSNAKAQSAMEYLMTYGWAILIMGVVLAALFALGLFNGGIASFSDTCIAISGFTCSAPVLHNGNFTATLGQATGSGWTSGNFIFVVGGGTPTNTIVSGGNTVVSGCIASAGALNSGGTISATFNVIGQFNTTTGQLRCTGGPLSTAIGHTYSGAIWAIYVSSSLSSATQIQQVATVTLKAT